MREDGGDLSLLSFHVEKGKPHMQNSVEKCPALPLKPVLSDLRNFPGHQGPFALGRREAPGRMQKVRLGGGGAHIAPRTLVEMEVSRDSCLCGVRSAPETDSRENVKSQLSQAQ